MLVGVAVMSVLFKNYFYMKYDNFNFSHYHTLAVISDLSSGGIIAYCAFQKKFLRLVNRITTTQTYLIYIAGFVFMISSNFLTDRLALAMAEILTSLFFLFVIVDQNFSKNSFFKMKNFSLISKLGKYTYGLYAYHLIAIFFVLKISKELSWPNTTIFSISVVLSLSLSGVISYISYEFFEKKFLSINRSTE